MIANNNFLAQSFVLVPASAKNPSNNDVLVPDIATADGSTPAILIAGIASQSEISQTLVDGCAAAVVTYLVGQGYTSANYSGLPSSGFTG